MTKTYLPALPGFTIWWVAQDNTLFKGEPVIGWLIQDTDTDPITIEGPLTKAVQRYAIELPDGRFLFPGEFTADNLEDARNYQNQLANEDRTRKIS